MQARAKFIREQAMHTSMTVDRSKAFECWTDDQYLEVRLRSLRDVVLMALVLHDEMRRFEPFGKRVLNSFLARHAASLALSPMPSESARLPERERLSHPWFVRYNDAHDSPTSRALHRSCCFEFAPRMRRRNDNRRLRSSRASDDGAAKSCGGSMRGHRCGSECSSFICSQNILALPPTAGRLRRSRAMWATRVVDQR